MLWVLVTTEHFRVYSDLDGQQVEALAADLENDLGLIAQAAFRKTTSAVEPTDVIVFSESAHFHRYFGESMGGVAYPRIPLLPESHHTVVTYEGHSKETRHTLRHELVHDVFARNFGAMPPWLSEGFAEYFSTVQLVEGVIRIGKRLPDLVPTRGGEFFGFTEQGIRGLAVPYLMIPAPSELLKMSAQEFYGLKRESFDEEDTSYRVAAQYFGAWAVVHFLMDAKGDYSRRFSRFLREVKTTSVTHAWEEAFAGVNMAKFDEDFRSYLVAGELAVFGMPYQKSSAGKTPQVRILAMGEKHVLLAKLSLAPRNVAAESKALFPEQIDAALRSQPPPPEAYYLRGMFARSRGKDADAERDFNQAHQLAPKDPRFLRAVLDHQLSQSTGEEGQERSEVVRKFRAEIEKLEALSTSPIELLLVAQFFAQAGEIDRALSLGKQGVRGAPVDPFVLSKYATVLESCGDLKSAVTTQRLALEFAYEDRKLQKQLGDELKRLESLAEQQRQHSSVP